MFDDNQRIGNTTLDPALADRFQSWAQPWINVPPGQQQAPLEMFACSRSGCHQAPLYTSPPTQDGFAKAMHFTGVFERRVLRHDDLPEQMIARNAINSFLDTVNAEIDRRNATLPPDQQIPRLDEHYRILTNTSTPKASLRDFTSRGFMSNVASATDWFLRPQDQQLLNPWFAIDRMTQYVVEQGTGFSAILGHQVTANTSWNNESQTRLGDLLTAANQRKIVLRAEGLMRGAQGRWIRSVATYDPVRRVFSDGSRTYTTRTLIRTAQQGNGYITFTAGAPQDLTRSPLIDNIVNANVPPVNNRRPLASLHANSGQVELLIRGSGFATGDHILNDGVWIGTVTNVADIGEGKVEGHFVFTVDPALANDFYILALQSVNSTTGGIGVMSNEFPIPVTP
jgi:hypothetical protein